ncbi:MAG: type II toxin-antitoxin system VapC family toxin [Anaerolineae bacterium]|jgi:predicted nucleic acid-binding protein|nr:type II toxin-antitoxin system VapC family toxin [Anaerolineae bacterium]
MRFVDTNVFIRHLTRDDPVKAQACYQLFLGAQRSEVVLTTSEAVVAEVVYVLSSKQLYNLPREQIRALLYPLLSLRGLKLTGREVYLRALDVYAASALDFEDALAVAHMERHHLTEIYSYDGHFDKVAGLTRLEP